LSRDKTEHLNLLLPRQDEFYDVDDFNENSKIIDTTLHRTQVDLTDLVSSPATGLAGISISTTASGTAAKVAPITDEIPLVIRPGALVGIRFTNTNTNANPTLNVGSTGAAGIRFNNLALPLATFIQRSVNYIFMFDGTFWQILNPTFPPVWSTQTITTNQNFIPVDGATYDLTVIGAGGGGSQAWTRGGAGGGSGFVRKMRWTAPNANPIACTIGLGGTAGSGMTTTNAVPGLGGTGGITSFGSILSAFGGTGGTPGIMFPGFGDRYGVGATIGKGGIGENNGGSAGFRGGGNRGGNPGRGPGVIFQHQIFSLSGGGGGGGYHTGPGGSNGERPPGADNNDPGAGGDGFGAGGGGGGAVVSGGNIGAPGGAGARGAIIIERVA